MQIGPYKISSPVILAPMAGITDLPFRMQVQRFGVGMTVAEMVSARPQLQQSRKHRQRRVSYDEPLPRAIQIVGNNPQEMANAAALNVDLGAGLIDINMGCPAKKVYRKAAGSALLADERQVQAIIEAVVAAVEVPVTLKIRTGISPEKNNAVRIAHIAEDNGIQSLAVHGRSRVCLFKGEAEYETVRQVKQAVSIPVVANGDISSPEKAQAVMRYTGADAVMIGRAAQGKPWFPSMVASFLANPNQSDTLIPDLIEQKHCCLSHIRALHAYYGNCKIGGDSKRGATGSKRYADSERHENMGVKIARKHIRWYLMRFEQGLALSQQINRVDDPAMTLALLEAFYDQQIEAGIRRSEALAA